MPNTCKVIVVMPAYNAERTLQKTFNEIPKSHIDDFILVDDCSRDRTVDIARQLNLTVIRHPKNTGYGGNQKTCYDTALKMGGDIIVMVHPDYQYDPSVLPQMIKPLQEGQVDIMLGSRMIKKLDALRGGMPFYKFFSNIFLTFSENFVFRLRLSEYHTGLRAYRKEFLKNINYHTFSDNFVFDTQIIAEAVKNGFRIGEVAIKTRYQSDSSSISFKDSIRYGLSTLAVLRTFVLEKYLYRKKVQAAV